MAKWICLAAAVCIAMAVPTLALIERAAGAVRDDPADRLVLALARAQIEAGSVDAGYRLLLVLERRNPDDRELQVLLARTEAARDDLDLAIRRLERVVRYEPDWKPGRIALIQACIAGERWTQAKRLLVAELGRDLDADERRTVERMARAVADRQTFVGRWSIGLTPDSNINNGAQVDTVQFLGLPFTLSDEAKAQQGVRADLSIGGTVRSRWREGTRLELSADATHSEPLGHEGSPSSNVRVAAAVRTRGPDGVLTAGLAVQPYWFESDKLRTETSVFLRPVRRIAGRTWAVGSLVLMEGEVYGSDARDFRQWETTLGPSFGVGETARVQLAGVIGHRNAEDNVFSFLRRGVQASVTAAPWNGWRIGARAAITRDVYEDFNIPFGARQEDLTREAGITVTKTDLVFLGVSPRLGLRWSETDSTIDFFDRDSVALTAGFALPY